MVLAVLLSGCSARTEMDRALALRGRLLGDAVDFRCTVTADYINTADIFSMDCTAETDGSLRFSVTEPESIAGISGTVSGSDGELTFAGDILAFPLLGDDRLSPAAAPWVLMNALKNGYSTSVGKEGEGLILTVDDSYDEDALTLQILTDEACNPAFAEVFLDGRRILSMEVEFSPSGA